MVTRYLIDAGGENIHTVYAIATALLKHDGLTLTSQQVIDDAMTSVLAFAESPHEIIMFQNIHDERVGINRLLNEIRAVVAATSGVGSNRYTTVLRMRIDWKGYQLFLEHRRDG